MFDVVFLSKGCEIFWQEPRRHSSLPLWEIWQWLKSKPPALSLQISNSIKCCMGKCLRLQYDNRLKSHHSRRWSSSLILCRIPFLTQAIRPGNVYNALRYREGVSNQSSKGQLFQLDQNHKFNDLVSIGQLIMWPAKLIETKTFINLVRNP